jgi:hypothetical protein
MEKFIYVFDTAARDALLQAGFCLLKADDDNSIYVFDCLEGYRDRFDLSASGFEFVLSNTLTF